MKQTYPYRQLHSTRDCTLVSVACTVIKGIVFLCLLLFEVLSRNVFGQVPNAEPPSVPPNANVQLTYNGDVELRALVDYVSQTLGMKILIEEGLGQQKISLNAPGDVPRDSLLPLLQSALRMKGFALVDANVPGWKRIVSAANMMEFVGPDILQPGENTTSEGPVTRIFLLQNADPKQVETTIKPFLSRASSSNQSGLTVANVVVVEGSRALIVSDFASNLLRIERLIHFLDKPKSMADMKFMPIKHLSAVDLAKQLNELAEARARAIGKTEKDATDLEIVSEPRTNQLILIGSPSSVKEFMDLASALDKPLNTVTQSYDLRYASIEQASKFAQTLRDSLPTDSTRPVNSGPTTVAI